jgi:fused signal recognition particle receptor
MDWTVAAWLGAAVLIVAGFLFFLRPRPRLESTTIDAPPSPVDLLFAALGRTREALSLGAIFSRPQLDTSAFEALEEALIRADVGPKITARLLEEVKASLPKEPSGEMLKAALKNRIREGLSRRPVGLAGSAAPLVILVVGVNGSGKTTTIGKLATRYQKAGKKVLLGAGDTFRAGAIEQLKVWGERAGVEVIAGQEGADPASVLHDTLQAALARKAEVVICDTAGRLQAHKALMEELAKIRRVIAKLIPGAPHEVLLVLDGTMGQNALSQARVFHEIAGVTGVVITKLDGTAKGGVLIAVAEEYQLPIKLIGIGEKAEDLRDFDPAAFANSLLG